MPSASQGVRDVVGAHHRQIVSPIATSSELFGAQRRGLSCDDRRRERAA